MIIKLAGRKTGQSPPNITNPEVLIATPINCIDAGAWYITIFRKGCLAAMDADNVHVLTYNINGGYKGEPERSNYTERIKRHCHE